MKNHNKDVFKVINGGLDHNDYNSVDNNMDGIIKSKHAINLGEKALCAVDEANDGLDIMNFNSSIYSDSVNAKKLDSMPIYQGELNKVAPKYPNKTANRANVNHNTRKRAEQERNRNKSNPLRKGLAMTALTASLLAAAHSIGSNKNFVADKEAGIADSVVVENGDTIWGIVERELADRYPDADIRELVDAVISVNPDLDLGHLEARTIVNIPEIGYTTLLNREVKPVEPIDIEVE